MNANYSQYTIRNIPKPVDRYLRKKARLTGKSLNQTIIEELSERAGVTADGEPQSLVDSLSWFIGMGADPEVEQILLEDDRQQKELAARELAKLRKAEECHDS